MEKDLFFKGIRPAVNVVALYLVWFKSTTIYLKLVTGNLRYELANLESTQFLLV